MALKKRTVINQVEIVRNGNIQVQEHKEVYDTLVTVVEADPENKISAVSDVDSFKNHRYVIDKGQSIPQEVLDFINNATG